MKDRDASPKKQKRKMPWDRRKPWADDYVINEEGKYVYNGKIYTWETPRKAALRKLWALALASFLLQILAGCVPHVGMNGRFWVLLPYAAALVASGSVLMAAYELTDSGDPLKEHSYQKSVEKLPGRSLLSALFSVLAFAGEMVNLLMWSQYDGTVSGALFYMFLETGGAVCAFFLRNHVRRLNFRESKGNGETEAEASEAN